VRRSATTPGSPTPGSPTTTAAGDPALASILGWWEQNARELPWRASRDVYAIWVSEVMSAQTSVTRACEAWVRWMERWPTVQALADASLAEVLMQWQGLGYPRRARDLHRSARIVAADGWPVDLTVLPGVGPYVAGAVRCFALEEPVLPLDVNIRRVLARRFPHGVDVTGNPWRSGQALMEFGQRICRARPACGRCPARAGCPAAPAVAVAARAGGATARAGGATARAGGATARAGGGPPPAARVGGDATRSSGTAALVDPAPRARRQAPYRGSLRERRGALLRRVLAEGEVAIADADHEAVRTLAADGLLRVTGDRLRPPS
jgi:A/G-specific adenine glycosylase